MPNVVYITGPKESISQVFVEDVLAEGFTVNLLVLEGNEAKYVNQLRHLADDLERDEKYAIIAFDEAATICLEHYTASSAHPHLTVLAAYHPTEIRSPKARYAPSTKLLAYLCSNQPFSASFETRRVVAEPGFAGRDHPAYREGPASTAWYETLAALRVAFNVPFDLQAKYEQYFAAKYVQEDIVPIQALLHPEAQVKLEPLADGTFSGPSLHDFFAKIWLGTTPQSMIVTSNCRTYASDAVVDEVIIDLKHDQRVLWLLPEHEATGKKISIRVVSIVQFKAQKVWRDRMYWDQAGVLKQVGGT